MTYDFLCVRCYFLMFHLRHFVLQALELYHFSQAAKDGPLEVTVLGWLHSQKDGAVVMASRVTAIVTKTVCEIAIEAIRKEKLLESRSVH